MLFQIMQIVYIYNWMILKKPQITKHGYLAFLMGLFHSSKPLGVVL